VADTEGGVWIGKSGTGLFRWKEGKISALPKSSGIDLEDIRSILIDGRNDFWITAWSRLYRLERSELEVAIEGNGTTLWPRVFTRRGGMPRLDFAMNPVFATLRSGLLMGIFGLRPEMGFWKCARSCWNRRLSDRFL